MPNIWIELKIWEAFKTNPVTEQKENQNNTHTPKTGQKNDSVYFPFPSF